MINNKKRLGILFAASAMLLAACGSDGDSAGGGGTSVLKVANGADPETFDIQATN